MCEASSDATTYEQASVAYYEAMCMCQWNFEPTDVLLLQVAMSYTIHLINANHIHKAILILENTINDALEDRDDHVSTNRPLVESLIECLNANLVHFQRIAVERKQVQSMGLELDEYSTEMIDFEEEQTNPKPDDTQFKDNSFKLIVENIFNYSIFLYKMC